MAVNSYDNVLRIYEHVTSGLNNNADSKCKLMHALKGYKVFLSLIKNKNWPIRSSFYYNRDGANFLNLRGSSEDIYKAINDILPGEELSTNIAHRSDTRALLATGSADPFVYIYSISHSEGKSDLVQRLEGHTDRVYSVCFHPKEPTLASCSADFTVKVWTSSTIRKR